MSKKIRALTRRLCLLYGTIDLRRTPDDQRVFLETSRASEWLFVEHRSGQPITEATAKTLVEPHRGAPE